VNLHPPPTWGDWPRLKPIPFAASLEAVDDVVVESPPHFVESLRWFYDDLIGLPEDPDQSDPDRCLVFLAGSYRLRIRMTPDALGSPNRIRATIFVDSLRRVMDRLDRRGYPYHLITGLAMTQTRVSLTDPFDNRTELKKHWPL
jgi:hypothetical protein